MENELVTARAVVNAIHYVYDGEGNLTRKRIITGGTERIVYYENADDNTVVKFTAGGQTVTSHSKTDSFGRKVFDELQLGTGCVSRQFAYHAGEVTDEHSENGKVKSSAVTQLVSQIVLSDGRTISYEYDAEERITKVIDSVDGTTVYTYDALGQLLTETKNGVVVNRMTYDNYGNIKTKNGITYTYGDGVWKDLLTCYNGKTITYDAQGNPTNYMGKTATWEKGRQLKAFDGVTFTYNANGIRTSKTLDGRTHTYTLDGTKILEEYWVGNALIPLYDNEDNVCGIIYNDVPYYFLKNLQGDVIAISNADGNTVARYSYDAWGVCTIVSDTSGRSIATVNPFRYRSYYYDNVTCLYYLQSRYYDPKTGRFINADDITMVCINNDRSMLNLGTYAFNSPIMFKDILGYSATIAIAAGVTISLGTVLAYLASFIAVVFLLALIFDRNFRKSLTTAINDTWNYAVDSVGYLTTAISEVITKAKKSRQYSGKDVHHIVAQKDPRAGVSRDILRRYGLSPYDAYNLVTISRTLHKHLHTSAYHYGVYLVLKALELKGKSRSDKKYYILSGLLIIGTLLMAASSAM